jgi:sulfur transfer complex TusBCD TusB component (DsrH family)
MLLNNTDGVDMYIILLQESDMLLIITDGVDMYILSPKRI